jgi:hypothetical protein
VAVTEEQDAAVDAPVMALYVALAKRSAEAFRSG